MARQRRRLRCRQIHNIRIPISIKRNTDTAHRKKVMCREKFLLYSMENEEKSTVFADSFETPRTDDRHPYMLAVGVVCGPDRVALTDADAYKLSAALYTVFCCVCVYGLLSCSSMDMYGWVSHDDLGHGADDGEMEFSVWQAVGSGFRRRQRPGKTAVADMGNKKSISFERCIVHLRAGRSEMQ